MIKRILVIQTAFLGDAILTLPLIQKIAEKYPNSNIDVVAIPSTEIIFRSSPFVKSVIVLDKKGEHKSIFGIINFAHKLKAEKYEIVYSPHRSFRTSLIVFFSGIRNSVGFDTASLSFVYKNRVKYDYNSHEVKRNLNLLNNESDDWKILPIVNIRQDVKVKIKEIILSKTNKQIACVAPGSVWKTKIYPEKYFYEIISFLTNKNFFVFLIGSNEDEVLCKNLERKFDENVFSVAGLLNVVETIELLRNSRILICNDSAPTHMGVAADISVLTLYCSTIKEFGFYPYNQKGQWLSYDNLQCKPCGIHGREKCPIETFDCGYNLKPSAVIDKISIMLNV
ncbi:glycosyltransferase family 9 protein [Melioribacteraceae bacterium 4301-Me]|uniref:glycosyltransferase family 9 protein n=1 Tax=Pyranulibacter aquaticus TaxID=3163344 RepID=UPI00359544C6